MNNNNNKMSDTEICGVHGRKQIRLARKFAPQHVWSQSTGEPDRWGKQGSTRRMPGKHILLKIHPSTAFLDIVTLECLQTAQQAFLLQQESQIYSPAMRFSDIDHLVWKMYPVSPHTERQSASLQCINCTIGCRWPTKESE